MAVGMSKPKASTRAGTMMNPPPTPKKPVMKPTTVPAATTLATVDSIGPALCPLRTARVAAEGSSAGVTPRSVAGAETEVGGLVGAVVTEEEFAAARAAAEIRFCARAVAHMRQAAIIMTPAKAARRTSGLTERLRRVPSKDPATPARLNHRPATTRTRPARQWPTIPPRAATPTTTRDVVTASFGPRPTT